MVQRSAVNHCYFRYQGETRNYTITVSEFTETLVGTWDVKKLTIYGGTGPEFGGGAVMQLTDKPWCWSETYGPQAECDNVLTFTMTGVTDEGNTSGICINDAGAVENMLISSSWVTVTKRIPV